MRGAKSAKWVAIAAAVALAATACGGSDDDNGGKGNGSGGKIDPNGIVKLANSEPQELLQPANTQETAGGQVVRALWTGLVDWTTEGDLVMRNAESVESPDGQTWTVKLKPGWKFHNGEAVTAKSYVDAWNWAANSENKQKLSFWFADIKGYEKLAPEEGKPTATELEGLKVVDDNTFTITLNNPVSYFNYKLAYSSFYPMPSEAIKDPEAFGEKPVGNGPYKFVSWDRKKKISVVRYDDYKGKNKAKNGGVDFVNYQTLEAEYDAVASNQADITTQVSPTNLPKYHEDFGDRAVDEPMAGIQSIQLNFEAPGWKDKSDDELKALIKGISKAIDRETITKTVLNGTRIPADALTAPGLKGTLYGTGVGNESISYDPAAAKKLIEEGGGVPKNTMYISYNADGGHKEWVEATCNSIREATGVECKGDSYPDFQSDLNAREAGKTKAFYRGGWVLDYPVNVNFLKELYHSKAPSNYGKFNYKKVDEMFAEGDSAATLDETVKKYQEAEKYLLNDVPMPAIPLWYYATNAVHSENVTNVHFDLANFSIVEDVQVLKK
ncbi:peptide ABC transporter substrate-binding protein [Streptomyces sp. KLOTTS4A1]|uniref:peptide ABC transporter substrate-binding protein n=1 Tax=Streptomyces sp. KLOTTS4A1 TaxID=3390996 RepID=UPI0039F5DD38